MFRNKTEQLLWRLVIACCKLNCGDDEDDNSGTDFCLDFGKFIFVSSRGKKR